MEYKNIYKGIFKERPNRFIAYVYINDELCVCHVKNTGRCSELLVPGCTVYLEKSDNDKRKTLYDLIAVEKGERIINMDSYAPNIAAGEWLKEKFGIRVHSEKTYGNSRLDFFVEGTDNEKPRYIEVKGVTLENDNVVSFPDAPTERGIKHIEELMHAKKEGYDAAILFVVQMENVDYFTPNYKTHKAFGEALKKAKEFGVDIWCFECIVDKKSMVINKEVKVIL